MKKLLSEGYGTKLKQAQPITIQEESVLWENGTFGNKDATTLQHTVFFYACKLFGLRGHDEHHDLMCEQFEIGENHLGRYIDFTGRSTKTFKGGLGQREIANKQIRHYCQNGDRCIADYFDQHVTALGKSSFFYRRSLAGSPVRYGEQRVGVNKLKTMMKTICQKDGLHGNYSNHPGKRTCATQLYIAGVEEQKIMARTGHRSERSVRKYKQSCPDIQRKVASVLDPPQPMSTATSVSTSTSSSTATSSSTIPSTCKKRRCEIEVDDMISPCKKSSMDLKPDVLKDMANGAYYSNCQISFNFH